jgi:putative endonuclease
MTDPRHALGERAESSAATWLGTLGWSVLDRRWRGPAGELDLVCIDPGGVLVGVEVKVRRTDRAGSGLESVERRRLGRLRGTLAAFASATAVAHQGARLDLVTLTPADDGRWRIQRLPAIDAW